MRGRMLETSQSPGSREQGCCAAGSVPATEDHSEQIDRVDLFAGPEGGPRLLLRRRGCSSSRLHVALGLARLNHGPLPPFPGALR